MGVIEDVYEDLDTDVEFEEFEAAVEDKVDQMGGLADEETAAMLIAHELRDEEADTIADIEPGMNDVKFLGKVTSIGDIRTFERDDEDAEEGRVCNVDVADASGSVRVALWDDMAAAAEEQLEVGQVLRVMGRPKEGVQRTRSERGQGRAGRGRRGRRAGARHLSGGGPLARCLRRGPRRAGARHGLDPHVRRRRRRL